METKFNFKSQIATDKNQSERLLALGLKKETADCYLVVEKEEVTVVAKPYYEIIEDLNSLPFDAEIIPAWSLHRLIEMAFNSLNDDNADAEDEIYFIRQKNPFESMLELFEWLIKEGYFNKEYLEE